MQTVSLKDIYVTSPALNCTKTSQFVLCALFQMFPINHPEMMGFHVLIQWSLGHKIYCKLHKYTVAIWNINPLSSFRPSLHAQTTNCRPISSESIGCLNTETWLQAKSEGVLKKAEPGRKKISGKLEANQICLWAFLPFTGAVQWCLLFSQLLSQRARRKPNGPKTKSVTD